MGRVKSNDGFLRETWKLVHVEEKARLCQDWVNYWSIIPIIEIILHITSRTTSQFPTNLEGR